jgi:two-component system response regulator ResD
MHKEMSMAKKHTPRILVVDDEKDIREITQAFLVLNGYDVTTAENGKEALDKLLTDSYDVVITDLQMPKMGGIELLEKISQNKLNAITIVLTGYAIKRSDFPKELFAHLRKPFSHKQLIQVVQVALKTKFINQQTKT